jgi:hypothetical protein
MFVNAQPFAESTEGNDPIGAPGSHGEEGTELEVFALLHCLKNNASPLSDLPARK